MTKGHVDLIERASRLFDKLYVGIFYNREKSGFFTIEARERVVKEALEHLDNVEVIISQLIAFQQDIAAYVPQSVIKELERINHEKN